MNRNLYEKIPGAPNFKYYELIESDTATRKNISNIPGEKEWLKLEQVMKYILQPVRDKFGPIKITSGYRSPELCLAIGSTINSNHTRGEAIDFKPFFSNVRMIDIIEFIVTELEYRELIAEYFPYGWIHVAFRMGGNNRILKLKSNTHNYEIVTLDKLKELYDK